MAARAYERLANTSFSADIRNELKRLAVTDDWHALLAVLIDYLIIAAAIVAAERSLWLYPLAVLLIGARQRALTTILHDAAHSRVAHSRWLNWVVGTYLSGYLIFQAFRPYRRSHVVCHHGHLGHPQRDPDFQLYLDSGLYSGLTPERFFWRQVLATLFMTNAPAYLWYVIKHRSIALMQSRGELVGLALLWAVILLIVGAFDAWSLLLMYWLVPYFTTFLVIGRFIEIAEHYPMLGTSESKTILHGTRNRFSHPLEALFFSMHNENYHLVHHLRPDIPFWNLHRAHRTMLEDPEYRRVNEQFGGVFLSRDCRPALIPELISGRLPLPETENQSHKFPIQPSEHQR
jgi:fatty acid desaturase